MSAPRFVPGDRILFTDGPLTARATVVGETGAHYRVHVDGERPDRTMLIPKWLPMRALTEHERSAERTHA